ncbi:MAG: hypothetical protein JXX14_26630 [Deltaproteobacteria bacterium]|nr:hypothetical protein [Deltaproteobacteria bacterium]
MIKTDTLHCGYCGGHVELPEDPAAVVASCPFCNRTFSIPDELLKAREENLNRIQADKRRAEENDARERANQEARRQLRWRLATIVVPILLISAGVTALIVYIQSQVASSQSALPSPSRSLPQNMPAASPPAPPPPEYSTDPDKTGATQVAARMKALYESGCRSIVHVAKQANGDIAWTPQFPDSKRADCLMVFAMTGYPENVLDLKMITPFGEPMPGPPPGPVIEHLFCGDTGGAHPLSVTATNGAPYTFAAIGCPRRLARKMRQK